MDTETETPQRPGYLEREMRELERMVVPWLTIIGLNVLSVTLLQKFVLLFEGPVDRARVCFFLSWYAQTMPERRRLEQATDFWPEKWVRPFLWVAQVTVCFVCAVALTLKTESLTVCVCVLGVFVVLKHALRSTDKVYPDRLSRAADIAVKTWLSFLVYGASASFFLLVNSPERSTEAPEGSVVLGGLVWPVLRHPLRWAVSRLLLDPHGTRGTVRVYTSLALDLPVLIAIYAEPDLLVVWALIACLAVVDSVAVVVMQLSGVASMFALSNQVWMNMIALNFLLNLRRFSGLDTAGFTQRVWYALLYLSGVAGLPYLYHALLHCLYLSNLKQPGDDLVLQTETDTETESEGPEEPEPEPLWWEVWLDKLPTLHADQAQVKRDSDLDFSDSAIPTSRHMEHLTRVVSESDSVCFLLWGVLFVLDSSKL